MNSNQLTRRNLIRNTSLLAAGAIATRLTGTAAGAIDLDKVQTVATKGRINQSVSQWCYGKWSLDELCQVVQEAGAQGHRPAGARAISPPSRSTAWWSRWSTPIR